MTAPRVIARIAAALLLALTSVAGLAVPCASAAAPASAITKSAEQPAASAHHHHDADQHATGHHTRALADSAMQPSGRNHDHASTQACFIHCLSAALPAVAPVRDAVIVTADHSVLPLPVLAGLRPVPLERPPNAAA